jgi:thioesterase domain-containing protein
MTDDTLRKMLEGLGHDGHVGLPLAGQDYEVVKNACESNMRIISTFSPERFAGDVLLFVAAHGHAEPPVESWKPYVDGCIRVHEIGCTHDAIMDAAPAAEIGKALAKELDKQRTNRQSLVQWRTK